LLKKEIFILENTEKIIEEETIVESGEKTFTQVEVNELIESRLARAKKQMPSKEELEAFKNWKDSQKSEGERQAQREQEFHQIHSEKEHLRRENVVLRSGVNWDDADYVLYKVSKIDGEFEENLKMFLTENSKFINSNSNTVKNTGVIPTTNNKINDDEGYLSILKRKHPNLF
jgi:hypothetical protein